MASGGASEGAARRRRQDRAREPRRHDDRILRLLHFRHRSGAGVRADVLPEIRPETQTLIAYLTFGLAFFARPVGSFLFGHFGDRIGRKSTLVATMLTMGLATTLIGAAADHTQSAGAFAPWALAALRFVQGIGLGGEWGGAARSRSKTRLWVNAPGTACSQPGPPIGFLIATGLFLLLLLAIRRGGVCRLGLAEFLPVQRRSGGDRTLCAGLARGDPGVQSHRARSACRRAVDGDSNT